MKKIMKSFRINKFLDDEVKKICKKYNISETSFYEMGAIEKIARNELLSNNYDEMINNIDLIIKSLEQAKNKLK